MTFRMFNWLNARLGRWTPEKVPFYMELLDEYKTPENLEVWGEPRLVWTFDENSHIDNIEAIVDATIKNYPDKFKFYFGSPNPEVPSDQFVIE